MPPWSYSSLTNFETCPFQFYRLRVKKDIVQQETEATVWGTQCHSALEHRVQNKTPLPEWARQWEPLAARFDRFDSVFVERKYGLTKSFQPTGFFDKDCWYRGVIDLGVSGRIALLLDWKTGKQKDDHDQLKLFSVTHMAAEPETQACRTGYIWLKNNKITRQDFTREDIPIIWQEFLPRIRRLELAYDADKWPHKPSGLCRGWCPVKDCPHYRSKTR